MITPYEIENKEFSKSMRGYNAVEVDDFLDLIILDLQKMLEDQENLKKTVKSLEAELAQYKRSETSVLNTLESAKKLMNDISESAEKRAEIIIRNAQMEAESLQRDARENISKLTEEGEKLKYKVARFRERYRQLLEDEMSQIEGSSEELFADLEREFMPASMEKTDDWTAPLEKTPKTSKADAGASAAPDVREDMKQRKTTVFQPGRPEESLQPEVKVRKLDKGDTMVVSEKSLEEMLMENYGLKEGDEKTFSKEDLAKTRIIK